jgi:hypothetical protein
MSRIILVFLVAFVLAPINVNANEFEHNYNEGGFFHEKVKIPADTTDPYEGWTEFGAHGQIQQIHMNTNVGQSPLGMIKQSIKQRAISFGTTNDRWSYGISVNRKGKLELGISYNFK